MKILGGEIRPQISAMTKDRSVFHQTISEKDGLTRQNVGVSEEDRVPSHP